eukprot:TRINITY_DN23606_c0_g1_i1.p3 TRINITY_DN23606_c0_g1~~TRINITY_DN23606_c0_g1_i1.p3  ORF type:complete len:102 (+),score=20.02 TRINITY_DN23606_c0_g1_i1:238-543(+)
MQRSSCSALECIQGPKFLDSQPRHVETTADRSSFSCRVRSAAVTQSQGFSELVDTLHSSLSQLRQSAPRSEKRSAEAGSKVAIDASSEARCSMAAAGHGAP